MDDVEEANMTQLPRHVQEYIYSVGIVDYFGAHAPLPEGCKLYETRAAARTASGIAAWAAARGYAWDAAGAAAWDAAEDAARTAAWTAVRAAAWDAAQTGALTAALAAALTAVDVAAWDAVDVAAGEAAWDAAGDAALAAVCLLMRDRIDPKHLAYALMRWTIWQAGYGVAAEIDGTHYCYRRP